MQELQALRKALWRQTLTAYLCNSCFNRRALRLNLSLVDATNPKPNLSNSLHGTFTGVDGAKAFFSGFVDLLEPGDFQVIASFGDNEHTASYGTLRHKVRQTDKDFVSDWALICQFQNDKIFLYHFYEDTEALLNAMR